MVRVYKRKSTGGSYGEERLKKALDAVNAGDSLSKAAGKFALPAHATCLPMCMRACVRVFLPARPPARPLACFRVCISA